MEAVLTTQISLYWSKLGKWQILTTILALVMPLAGHKDVATFAAVALFSIAGLVAIIFFDTTIISLAIAAIASFAGFGTASIFPCIILGAIAILYDDSMKYGVRKRVVWLSYAAEFVAVLWLLSLFH